MRISLGSERSAVGKTCLIISNRFVGSAPHSAATFFRCLHPRLAKFWSMGSPPTGAHDRLRGNTLRSQGRSLVQLAPSFSGHLREQSGMETTTTERLIRRAARNFFGMPVFKSG